MAARPAWRNRLAPPSGCPSMIAGPAQKSDPARRRAGRIHLISTSLAGTDSPASSSSRSDARLLASGRHPFLLLRPHGRWAIRDGASQRTAHDVEHVGAGDLIVPSLATVIHQDPEEPQEQWQRGEETT